MAITMQDFYSATPSTTGVGSLAGMFMSGAYPSAGVPSGTSSGGALVGAAGYNSAYGGIPVVPGLQATQTSALAGNMAAMPSITGIGSAVNQFNQQQQLGQYQMYNPQLMSQLGQSASNISAALGGQVPIDVQNRIAQTAAERGVGLGVPGSQASEYNFLRGLGLTSLDMQRYGESALTASMGRTPRTALYDISSMFVSPQQQQQWAWQQAVTESMPVPASAAAAQQALAAAGLRSGYGTGGMTTGAYNPYWSALARPTTAGSSQVYPGMGMTGPAGGTATSYLPPATPGWGTASSSTGGYATYGTPPSSSYVPQSAQPSSGYFSPSYYPSNDQMEGYIDPYEALSFYDSYGEWPPYEWINQ